MVGLLEFFESVEAEAQGPEGTGDRVLPICGGGEAEEVLLEQQLLLAYEAAKPRRRRQQQQQQQRQQQPFALPSCCWGCQLPPPLVSPAASAAVARAFDAVASSPSPAVADALQQQQRQQQQLSAVLGLMRAEAAVERLWETLPCNRQLLCRLLSPAAATANAAAAAGSLSLPVSAEGDRTSVLDGDLGIKAWALGPLLHQQQALQRAEELLISRPLHSHAVAALAAARAKAAAAAAAAEPQQQQQQRRRQEQQESGALVETEGDTMPLADAAEDLEKAAAHATAVFGYIGVEQLLQQRRRSSSSSTRRCRRGKEKSSGRHRSNSKKQHKHRDDSSLDEKRSSSSISSSKQSSRSSMASYFEVYRHLVTAAEACEPCVLLPLQAPPAALVERFAGETLEQLPSLPLPHAASAAAAPAAAAAAGRQEALQFLLQQQQLRLQWLGTPNVCYEGTAVSLYHLLIASLLQQMGCAESFIETCNTEAAGATAAAAAAAEETPGELLLHDTAAAAAAAAPDASGGESLAAAVAELLQPYRDSGAAGVQHAAPTGATEAAAAAARGGSGPVEETPEPEEPQQQEQQQQQQEDMVDELHSKYAAPDWSFRGFVCERLSRRFGLRGGSSSFTEGGGCGTGRALPLRFESACSFATSKKERQKNSKEIPNKEPQETYT